MGFCPGCGERTPLVEVIQPASHSGYHWVSALAAEPQELSRISIDEEYRIPLPFAEMNRVLGGGLVPGSVLLLAGEPGVGKSTLLLQAAQALAHEDKKVLYVSGEESAHQIKLRCQRLGLYGQGIYFLSETDVDSVLRHLGEMMPALAVIDSIQTLYTQEIPSGPGSVAQVRECTRRLMGWSKYQKVPLFVTGHVTKDGTVAGPRVLEHMVDVVLYLEGESLSSYRILRGVKNRFGSTNEIGLFHMGGRGMEEVSDPSQALLAERAAEAVGSAIVPIVEGSRPLLVEVQALNSPSMLPTPRRVANGVEFNRLLMLVAVLARRAGLKLANQDIIVNVAGGLRISEPAADLGIALAIASSTHNRPLPMGLAAIGEIGLSGELRTVPQLDRRLAECARLGLSRCIIPSISKGKLEEPSGIELDFASTVRQAIGLSLARKGQVNSRN